LFNGADLNVQMNLSSDEKWQRDNTRKQQGKVSRVVLINVCWIWYLFWYMHINVLLNWDDLTMKLRSSFVFKRTVTWKTTVLKRERFINMSTCVGAMNHKIQAQDGILL
jgi:hypothetical protein